MVVLFVSMGVGIVVQGGQMVVLLVLFGVVVGVVVVLIFFLCMWIELIVGKVGIKQVFVGGFEIEDVLYLLLIVMFVDGVELFLFVVLIGVLLFVVWVVIDWWCIVCCGSIVLQNFFEIQVFK